MRLSTAAGRYGVRAMYDLAIRYGNGPVPGKDIARRQNISLPYLDQLMARLRRSSLVKSVRGPQGGYLLSRSPARIKVGEIVRSVEGPIRLSYCLGDSNAPSSCARAETCVSRVLLKKLSTHIMSALDSTTLEDLCREAGTVSCPVRRPRKTRAKGVGTGKGRTARRVIARRSSRSRPARARARGRPKE